MFRLTFVSFDVLIELSIDCGYIGSAINDDGITDDAYAAVDIDCDHIGGGIDDDGICGAR